MADTHASLSPPSRSPLAVFPAQSPALRFPSDLGAEQAGLYVLLALHALVWTLASGLYRSNLDWAGDMLENYVWGIEWQAGYHKHPPLFAWITAAWFSVFPRTDLAYFALSNVNALVGLCGIAALARRFIPPGQAAVAALAMAVSPIYTTLAIKFNANTVLLSVWPWVAYCFVRYVQEGTRKLALALGAVAALAMLGKYFSVVVLAGLAAAAMARPAWRARVLRPESLLVIMAGTIVLLPHVRWLLQSGMPTFTYARERMAEIEHPLAVVAADMLAYALTQWAYLLPCMAFVLLMARQKRGHAARLMLLGFLRRSTDRDLWWLSMGTLLAIGVLALATRTRVSVLWGNAQWFAIVPLWLVILRNGGVALDTRRIPRLMAAYWVVVLGVSALAGYMRVASHERLAVEPRAELAQAARAAWSRHMGTPLAIVAGNDKEARSIAFYGAGLTRYWELFDPATTPWLSAADVRRQGALFVCRAADESCRDAATSFSGVGPVAVDVAKRRWGVPLPARRYLLYMMPGQSS
ncbi:glycosyltransferase family 39 protein [Bordetella flabilis]|nr:glycosyltransferase family 39 protein [Bordetella flabilis]